MNRIIVVGGGIAGLSAAYYAQKNIPDAHITLIESASQWGGKITTDRVAVDAGADAFIIEGRPDTFLATKPWGVALCRELGLGERLHGTNPQQKSTYVLRNNCLHPLPDGLTMMVPTRVGPMVRTRLLSWPQKARLGLDYVLPPRPLNGDESLGEFVSRRLGRADVQAGAVPGLEGEGQNAHAAACSEADVAVKATSPRSSLRRSRPRR